MNNILHSWSGLRFLRLLMGVAALVQGIVQKEGLLIIAGSWLLVGAIFNTGCCGSGACSVPITNRKAKHVADEQKP